MKYGFIGRHAGRYRVTMLCRVLGVQRSAYYAWRGQPGKAIEPQELALRGRMKALFAASRGSLGSRMLMNNLNQEGFQIGRERRRGLMKTLNLKLRHKRKYKVTTDSKHRLPVAQHGLNRAFSPSAPNQAWGADITYLMSLAIDADQHLIKVPAPVRPVAPVYPPFPDLASKHRTEPVPPIAHRLVADVDTTFEHDVFDLAQRQRIADVHHHRETDDLGRAVKITKGMVHYHRLREVPLQLNPIFSDNAITAVRLTVIVFDYGPIRSGVATAGGLCWLPANRRRRVRRIPASGQRPCYFTAIVKLISLKSKSF